MSAALDPRSSLKSEESLGQVRTLTCPLLEKLRDAITHVGRYIKGLPIPYGQTSYISGDVHRGQGDYRAGWGRAAVTWDKDAGMLVLCFSAYDAMILALTSEKAAAALAAMAREPASAPAWLAEFDSAALISSPVLAMFEGQREALAVCIEALTGGVAPQQIKCFGWCIAGMTATVAATWAALQYPSADVRCITFGGQKLGNAAFALTFRWLVGLSYRVVYNRDPVPSHKAKAGLLASELVHVHGEIYIEDALVRPGGQPAPHGGACGDHDWVKYSQALRSSCQMELKRQLASQEEACRNPEHANSPPSNSNSSLASEAAEPQQSGETSAVEELTAQLAGAGTPSTAEGLAMLKGCPGIRESGDLGQQDSVPQIAPSVFSPAASGPGCDDSAPGAAAVAASGLQGGAAMARDNSANVSSETWAGGARPSGPQKLRAVIAGESDDRAAPADLGRLSSLHVAAHADSITSLEKVLLAGKISQAALLSAAAYRDEESFRRTTGIAKCRLVVDKNERNTHVHVGWLDDGTAVLSFRGTATVQDGLADVQIMHRDVHYMRDLFPGSRAHLGFLKQFMGVCKPDQTHGHLAAVVRELSGGRAPSRVLCCGHSLGGALATLGAAWAALQWSQADVRCITFGSPRVGNRPFKQAFHSLVGTSYRLVHGRDPVPALPPSIVYRHVDGAIHIQPDGRVALKSRPWFFKYPPNLGHHSMIHYTAGICLHFPEILRALPVLRRLVSKAAAAAVAAQAGTDGILADANGRQRSSQGSDLVDADLDPEEAESLQRNQSALRLLCGLLA